MGEHKLIITPKTKVGELLDSYPQLESLLIEMAPAFSKLKHPVLRKTIAKVATLQQAAGVGNVNINELVLRLRKAVGQDDELGTSTDNQDYTSVVIPEWCHPELVSIRFNAVDIINRGESPMNEIIALAQKLDGHQIMELITPFVPVPIIDMLRKKGFTTFSRNDGDTILSYIKRD